MNTVPSEIGRRGPAWLQCSKLDRKGPGEGWGGRGSKKPAPAGPCVPQEELSASLQVSRQPVKCSGHGRVVQTFLNLHF